MYLSKDGKVSCKSLSPGALGPWSPALEPCMEPCLSSAANIFGQHFPLSHSSHLSVHNW